ncbi:15460_t:CDS:1, partial [Dentiscutata heterogama]
MSVTVIKMELGFAYYCRAIIIQSIEEAKLRVFDSSMIPIQ